MESFGSNSYEVAGFTQFTRDKNQIVPNPFGPVIGLLLRQISQMESFGSNSYEVASFTQFTRDKNQIVPNLFGPVIGLLLR